MRLPWAAIAFAEDVVYVQFYRRNIVLASWNRILLFVIWFLLFVCWTGCAEEELERPEKPGTEGSEVGSEIDDTAGTEGSEVGSPWVGTECVEDVDCGGGDCRWATCLLGRCFGGYLEGKKCDDGDLCTRDDRCSEGKCRGVSLECDDGNSCTLDRCDSGVCTFQPRKSRECRLDTRVVVPERGAIQLASQPLSVRASVRSPAGEVASVLCNGDSMRRNGSGDYQKTLRLLPGMRQIAIVATDSFGRTAEGYRSVLALDTACADPASSECEPLVDFFFGADTLSSLNSDSGEGAETLAQVAVGVVNALGSYDDLVKLLQTKMPEVEMGWCTWKTRVERPRFHLRWLKVRLTDGGFVLEGAMSQIQIGVGAHSQRCPDGTGHIRVGRVEFTVQANLSLDDGLFDLTDIHSRIRLRGVRFEFTSGPGAMLNWVGGAFQKQVRLALQSAAELFIQRLLSVDLQFALNRIRSVWLDWQIPKLGGSGDFEGAVRLIPRKLSLASDGLRIRFGLQFKAQSPAKSSRHNPPFLQAHPLPSLEQWQVTEGQIALRMSFNAVNTLLDLLWKGEVMDGELRLPAGLAALLPKRLHLEPKLPIIAAAGRSPNRLLLHLGELEIGPGLGTEGDGAWGSGELVGVFEQVGSQLLVSLTETNRVQIDGIDQMLHSGWATGEPLTKLILSGLRNQVESQHQIVPGFTLDLGSVVGAESPTLWIAPTGFSADQWGVSVPVSVSMAH